MEIKEGTLVRVCSPINDFEAEVAKEHGTLWLHVKSIPFDENEYGAHVFKSLATGIEYTWYDEEIEVPDDEAV